MVALRRAGRLGNTLVIFLSDNGYLWGEHRLDGKGVPYEESIRVPFVVRYDPAGRAGQSPGGMVLNIDIAPTIVELSGVPAPRMDGQSLVPLLTGAGAWSRNDFLIEHVGGGEPPTWCAMRTQRYLYAVYGRGGRELYFLREDPLELDNRINDTRRALVERLDARLRVLCNPPPPGFKLRS
jgi:N-acetylglucosamine-6-sulfatase